MPFSNHRLGDSTLFRANLINVRTSSSILCLLQSEIATTTTTTTTINKNTTKFLRFCSLEQKQRQLNCMFICHQIEYGASKNLIRKETFACSFRISLRNQFGCQVASTRLASPGLESKKRTLEQCLTCLRSIELANIYMIYGSR